MAKYPLKQLIEIKKKRVEDAELILMEKKKELQKEELKLEKLKQKKEEMKAHYDEKLDAFYGSFSEGTTPDKINRTKGYLKQVLEDIKNQQKKIEEQIEVVKKAEEAVQAAKKVLDQRKVDLEKIEMHEEEWIKEAIKEEERQFNIEQDELGATSHEFKKRQQKRRS